MPQGINGVGEGIAQGVDNFINIFTSMSDRKRQQRLEKYKPTIEAIKARLVDDTVSLDDRATLLDQLQEVYKLAGLNPKLPNGQKLSDIILPSHIRDQIQQIGETANVDAVNAVPEGESQTENVTTSPVQINLTKRRGEMSPQEIQLSFQRMAHKGQMSDELAKQEDYARFQAKLNDEIASKQYVKNPEEVVEPKTGRVWSVYTSPNSKFPVIFQPLGLYKSARGELITAPEETTIPLSTYNARTKAAGSNGLGATFNSLKFSVARELGLPQDDPQVLDETAKRFAEQYAAKTSGLQYGAVGGQQRTEGTVPVQPAEKQRIDIENKKYIAGLKGQIDSFEGVISTEDEEVNSVQKRIDAIDKQINDLVKNQGYDATDREVVALQDRKDDLLDRQNAAKRRKAAAEKQRNRVQGELNSYQSPTGAIESEGKSSESNDASVSGTTDTKESEKGGLYGRVTGEGIGVAVGGFTPEERIIIGNFRATPRNQKPPFDAWTNEQIVEWARKKGYLPPKKMN